MNKVGTVVFDFDGVIHSYKSGWQGVEVIPDPPVPGIKEAIEEIRSAGYEVVVVSTRCAYTYGFNAIRNWLNTYNISVDDVQKDKPPAICYIDDRAICFDGHPETLLDKIRAFEPWNHRVVPVHSRWCPYCCDNEDGDCRSKYSYDDEDGMTMSIHPSKKLESGYQSKAWWATVTFRGESRDFYIEVCPFCGRRLVPLREVHGDESCPMTKEDT